MGCDVNISLAALHNVTWRGLLRRETERAQTSRIAQQMRVKVPSVGTPVGTLSGGNQQKVVLARWLFRDSDVLIVDEPTRGIDVGARHEIYNLLADQVRQGKGIVMVSSDLKELMGMCHRILVFSRGQVVADVPRVDFDQEHILTLAYSRLTGSGASGVVGTDWGRGDQPGGSQDSGDQDGADQAPAGDVDEQHPDDPDAAGGRDAGFSPMRER